MEVVQPLQLNITMKNVRVKFDTLIRTLNYNCIKLRNGLDVEEIKAWANKRMPLVVQELEDNGWDFSNDDTWLENTFVTHVLDWYGKRVVLFITSSAADYELCKKTLKYKAFKDFRNKFKIDNHAALLLHPVIFMTANDLDDIFTTLDFKKGWSALDFSHFDEDEKLDEAYQEDWGWLSLNDDDDDEWDANQVAKAYSRSIYD